MGGKRTLTADHIGEHPPVMLKVRSAPVIESDPQRGWQLLFWMSDAFDYDTPFRDALSDIVAILKSAEPVTLELPPYASDEDFVEGSLLVGASKLETYYEHSLGYLALISDDRETLDAVAAKVLPFVEVSRT